MSSSTSSSPAPATATDGKAPIGSRIVRIDSITLGQQVTKLAVQLHIAPSTATDTTNVSESGARSRKKAKGASSTSKKFTPKIAPTNNVVGVSTQAGFVRVLLTDATASIIAEVPTPSMDQLSKEVGSDALNVLVDGCAEMCEGKLILRGSSHRADLRKDKLMLIFSNLSLAIACC